MERIEEDKLKSNAKLWYDEGFEDRERSILKLIDKKIKDIKTLINGFPSKEGIESSLIVIKELKVLKKEIELQK